MFLKPNFPRQIEYFVNQCLLFSASCLQIYNKYINVKSLSLEAAHHQLFGSTLVLDQVKLTKNKSYAYVLGQLYKCIYSYTAVTMEALHLTSIRCI